MILSTGKEIYVNREVIGIDTHLELYEGYDGGIDEDRLTLDEKIEIADLMINRWKDFKVKTLLLNQNE